MAEILFGKLGVRRTAGYGRNFARRERLRTDRVDGVVDREQFAIAVAIDELEPESAERRVSDENDVA